MKNHLWNLGHNPSMERLKKDGLFERAKEEIIAEATASLKRVHGDKPSYPEIDNYHALELAAEGWLARYDAAQQPNNPIQRREASSGMPGSPL